METFQTDRNSFVRKFVYEQRKILFYDFLRDLLKQIFEISFIIDKIAF